MINEAGRNYPNHHLTTDTITINELSSDTAIFITDIRLRCCPGHIK